MVDTGFVTANEKDFVWLDRWCTYRYLLHTAGFAYSAGLKYKLACGSVILLFESKYQEFYYPALKVSVGGRSVWGLPLCCSNPSTRSSITRP